MARHLPIISRNLKVPRNETKILDLQDPNFETHSLRLHEND